LKNDKAVYRRDQVISLDVPKFEEVSLINLNTPIDITRCESDLSLSKLLLLILSSWRTIRNWWGIYLILKKEKCQKEISSTQ